jgi:anthranilate synthase component 1
MTLKEIKRSASELGYPCIIPVVRAIRNTEDLLPTDVYAKLIDGGDYSFLLESAELGEKIARYSFLGRNPEKTITIRNGRLAINGEEVKTKNPLHELSKLVSRYNVQIGKLPKFFGGLLGYFGYDMVRYFEDIGDLTKDELRQNDALFIFVKNLIAFDHWRDEILLISNHIIEGKDDVEKEYESAQKHIEEMEALLNRVKKQKTSPFSNSKKIKVKSNFKREDFESAVASAKEHIRAGDIFQVVLSQRFEVEGSFDPFNVYLALKEINPSPYMYLLDFGRTKIIGSSPEILVKVDDKTVTVRPIAGTRPRGKDIVEDEFLSREMVNDEKERAEHVMLVDLGRNDIGKISRFGSVEVNEFFGIEKYSHVQHIISNVKGEIREGLSSFDALEAAFPAGTVTGAPKVRAMQIIEELEPSRRGIYAGSVGYFCFDGNMDFAITIRTIVMENGRAYVQAGAGIVADSLPEREYRETLNKGRGMLKALELAGDSNG